MGSSKNIEKLLAIAVCTVLMQVLRCVGVEVEVSPARTERSHRNAGRLT
jgi:hypothetical protein